MRRTSFCCYLIVGFCFLVFQCSEISSNDVEEVNAVMYKLIDADNRSDIGVVMSSYTDSIEFYPAGKEMIRGFQNVQKNYERLFETYKLSITTDITETLVFGKAAMITGTNKVERTSIANDSTVLLEDHYVAILRNRKGVWKIDKLIWGPKK